MITRYKFLIAFTILIGLSYASAQSNDEETSKWLMNNLPNTEDDSDGFSLDPIDTEPGGPQFAVPLGVTPGTTSTSTSTTTAAPEPDLDLNPEGGYRTVACKTNTGHTGVCVLFYQCSEEKTVITDGAGILDVRQKEVCPSSLEVCCLLSHVMRDALPPSTVPPSAVLDYEDNGPRAEVPASKRSEVTKCGLSNPALNLFKPNSNDTGLTKNAAYYGEFPWAIALLKKNKRKTKVWSRNDFLGGGSLIHPAVVVTAAHKLEGLEANKIKCRAGEWDTQTNQELFDFQERDVKTIVKHPDYFLTSVYNDIALLYMERPFELQLAPHIGTVCLGRVMPPEGTMCYSMGWGKDQTQRAYVNVLKKVELPLIKHDTCEKHMKGTERFGQTFELHGSLMCAGGVPDVDSCTGDGGSSLVCPIGSVGESTRYAIVGMVAYGVSKDCGTADPSVYVNMPHLQHWVDTQMDHDGYGTDIYTYPIINKN